MIEEKAFDVEVTLTFRTRVPFSAIDRDGPITKEDALENFYGYGLSDVLDSGEYSVGYDHIRVTEVDY